MVSKDDETLVLRFLYGQFSDEELKSFLIRLDSDQLLRNSLHENISLESLLLEQMKMNPDISGLLNESAWAQAIVSESSLSNTDNSLLAEYQWKELIQSAYIQTERIKTVRFRFSISRYLAAACLILSAGLAVFSFRYFYNSHTSDSTVKTADKVVHVHLSDSIKTQAIATDNETEIIQFSGQTGFLAEKNTQFTMREKRDTTVTLELTDGSVLFKVEKGKYRKFVVLTPYAKITVTGTTFRVTIKDENTVVSVMEGSVNIIHNLKDQESTLLAGGSIMVNRDSMINTNFDLQSDIPKRKLLADFLEQQFVSSQYSMNIGDHVKQDSVISSVTVTPDKSSSNCLNGSRFKVSYNSMRAWDILSGIEESNTDSMEERINRNYSQMLSEGDTGRGIDSLYFYLRNNSSLVIKEIVINKLLQYYYEKENVDSTEQLMHQFYRAANRQFKDDLIVFDHAEFLRNREYYREALDWYSFYADHFPEGIRRQDALYQIGWCLIQDRLENRKSARLKK